MIDTDIRDKQKVGASLNGMLLKSDIFPGSSAVSIARRLDIKSPFYTVCVNNTLQKIKTLAPLRFNPPPTQVYTLIESFSEFVEIESFLNFLP